MIDYPYLGRNYVDGKAYVVMFLEAGKGVVLVNETDRENIKFGTYAEFDEDSFELLPPDEVVRLSN